jgi:hypothetical protein
MIAAALFFALRREPSPSATSAPTPATAATTTAPPTATATTTAELRPSDRAVKAQEDARLSLETHRKVFFERCFRSIAPDAGLHQAAIDVELSFDAAGAETKRSARASLTRTSSKALADCVQGVVGTATKITPPGEPITVVVELPFP